MYKLQKLLLDIHAESGVFIRGNHIALTRLFLFTMCRCHDAIGV